MFIALLETYIKNALTKCGPQRHTPKTHHFCMMFFIKSMFVMLAGAAAYAVKALLLKDVLDQINVCDDCRCGCVGRKRIVFEGCP
jgi:hypothetical protein